jgi:hypothetical protein
MPLGVTVLGLMVYFFSQLHTEWGNTMQMLLSKDLVALSDIQAIFYQD